MPLLPKKLARSQEEPGPHLPADHIRPLIDQHWEVAIALNPAREHGVDDRFRRGANDVWLLKLLPARVRHHRELRGEAFDMLCFLPQESLGDEQWEVGVPVPGLFEHLV